MSARLHKASRQTLTSGSFLGYSLIMETSLAMTPLWTNWSCWYADKEEKFKEKELTVGIKTRCWKPKFRRNWYQKGLKVRHREKVGFHS